MGSIVAGLLVVVSGVSGYFGGYAFAHAEGAIHEIEAGVFILIAVVALVGATALPYLQGLAGNTLGGSKTPPEA